VSKYLGSLRQCQYRPQAYSCIVRLATADEAASVVSPLTTASLLPTAAPCPARARPASSLVNAPPPIVTFPSLMRGRCGQSSSVTCMNDEDGRLLTELLGVLGESEPWARRPSSAAGLEPALRSPMRGDDDRLHPYEISHAAWHSLGHAVDHLTCLLVLLGGVRVVPMYAPFSLVRAVVENTCAAVWMLQPPQRPERLIRRLRFAVTDIRNGEEAKEITRQPGPRRSRTG